jgi:AAA15 family ATPase/GTPase
VTNAITEMKILIKPCSSTNRNRIVRDKNPPEWMNPILCKKNKKLLAADNTLTLNQVITNWQTNHWHTQSLEL